YPLQHPSFFLPLPPPPTSTLFPYTTLFRSLCALRHSNPFELLCATILSAQTTDERVNLVTPALFARYPSVADLAAAALADVEAIDRKSTRLNSSHLVISYAVFCLKKKKKQQ